MAPRLFSPDMEAMLLEQCEDVWVKASGSTLRAAEKYALIDTRINDEGKRKIGRLSLVQNLMCKRKCTLFAARGGVSTRVSAGGPGLVLQCPRILIWMYVCVVTD